MTVAAGHAALLLAQGAGRLLRRSEDRGGGRGARLPDGDRALRRLSARLAAAVLDHDRPGPRQRRTSAATHPGHAVTEQR